MTIEITDKKIWDALHVINRIPSGHFLQSWQWGEFQKSLGRKVLRFSDMKSLASVVELPLPFGKKYWYCPKGPLGAIDGFLPDLEEQSKNAGAIFLRIEPFFTFRTAVPKVKNAKSVQPKSTSIVDLAKSEDELLAAMHEKTRYNIRVAERHGVVVERHVDATAIFDEVYELFKTTASRDRFGLHPKEYYAKQLAAFREPEPVVPGAHTPHVNTFVARFEGKLLAAAIVMFDGETTTYLHGASSNEHRNVMAPHALHWAIIRRAKERGYKHYDLWGIDTGDEPGWAGITRFKVGFGGETISAPGTFDLPIDRLWYSVYQVVRKIL